MPPKVILEERGMVPVIVSDDGMMIFLSDGLVRCIQIYDAVNKVG